MKCPECIKQGLRSRVKPDLTPKIRHAVYIIVKTYWDEDGVYHSHDPEITTTHYLCSNGHEFSKTRQNPCGAPGCDYGRLKEGT